MQKVALLLSHLPKKICGSDLPLTRLKTATAFLKSQNVQVVTSAGQSHWDCILSLLLDFEISVHLVIPKPLIFADVPEQFLFTPALTADNFTMVDSPAERDNQVCSMSDKVYPLWLRKSGHLAKIVASLPPDKIDLRFDCSAYRFANAVQKYSLPPPSTEIESLPKNYLWHWTRGKHDAWSGETAREFCRDLLNSTKPPRDALATLLRILREQKIRANGTHIAENVPVAAFTENHPAKMNAMLTWRRDLHRMNFEPYGIGIPIQYAISKGVQKLQYGAKPNWNTMQPGNNWQAEREWRVRGDFVLDKNSVKEMIVVVRCQQEIVAIKEIFVGNIVAYE